MIMWGWGYGSLYTVLLHVLILVHQLLLWLLALFLAPQDLYTLLYTIVDYLGLKLVFFLCFLLILFHFLYVPVLRLFSLRTNLDHSIVSAPATSTRNTCGTSVESRIWDTWCRIWTLGAVPQVSRSQVDLLRAGRLIFLSGLPGVPSV